MRRIFPTGCGSLDKLLDGGFPRNSLSLIYGEAETGKSSLAVQCAVNTARMGHKTIFIDSDGTFSPMRLSQIAGHDSEKVSPLITLVKPTTFEEQAVAIDSLESYMTKAVGLVVVDTVTSLYRVELGNAKKTFKLNRELHRQIAGLAQVAKTLEIAALIISQVRSVFTNAHMNEEPVATRVLRFWSDIVLNIKPTSRSYVMKAFLEKHPKRKRPMSCYFSIESSGICDLLH